MIRKLALLAPTLSLLVSCGDDEPTPARQRCEVDGAAYFAQGQLALADDTASAVQLEGSSAPGLISGPSLVVRMASVTVEGQRYPLLMRLQSSGADTSDLLNRISRATIDGPLAVTIADASRIAPGSNNISGLSRYDCDLEQGRLCAQLAVDRDLDGLVSDADQLVFNARSGEVRFTRAVSSRIALDWSLEVGANMFARDASTPGALAGCVNTQYRQGLGGAWELF